MYSIIIATTATLIISIIFVLVSCNVTFPKETLEQDTKDFIKKEANIDSNVYVYGTTMYLDVVFDDLAFTKLT